MNKEAFIERAVAVHGNKFDYSLLPDEFKSKDKVPVICDKHGVFYITSGNHISNKRGCSSCGNIGRSENNRKDLSSFKEQLSLKFPNVIINYTGYEDTNSSVQVYCEVHGWESRKLKDFLKSTYSCNQCALTNRGLVRRKSLDEFLLKANEVHNNKYDYSKVEFESFGKPVTIICEHHGEFQQTPTVHIKGHGCIHCRNISVGASKRKPLDEVPKRFTEDPNIEMDVSSYTKATAPVRFVCRRHGEFFRKLTKVKGESVCPQCNIESKSELRRSNTEEFIAKALRVFPLYDYTEVNYTSVSDYVKVTCDKNHTFEQRAGNLLQGFGCTNCSNTGFSYNKVGYLYLILLDNSFIKFGISNKPSDRFKTLKRNSKFDTKQIELFEYQNGWDAKVLEDRIKQSGIEIGVVDKQDLSSGYTETFHIRDLDFIIKLISDFNSQLL